MLVHLGFEDLVFSVSNVGLVCQGSSVLVDVGSELSQSVGQSVSGWEEDIINHIVSVEDISVGILDFLGESGNISIVVVSSSVELMDQFCKFVFEVTNELLDSLHELLKVALGLQVQLGVVQDEASPV